MDPLTALLESPRASGAFLLQVSMSAPWSLRIQDRAPLTVVAMVSGGAVLQRGDETTSITTGDVVLLTGLTPYVFADRPGRAPYVVIQPGNRAETVSGASLDAPLSHGVRRWGNDPQGGDRFVVGNYSGSGEVERRLLDAVPDTIVLRAAHWHSPLVDIVLAEAGEDRAGQGALLDRLLDALVVSAFRQWAETADDVPLWLGTTGDEAVMTALRLMHQAPEHPWSVVSLARAAGLSRAGFARRFLGAVGQPPISYLAQWRLALAGDRLRAGPDPVQRIAADLGYASPFTFSAAFKRRYAVSPSAWRAAGRPAA